MNNITASKKIHSLDDARNLAKKRMPKLMFDFVDGASGDEKLCEINSTALDQIRLEPKVLRNVENRILKKKILPALSPPLLRKQVMNLKTAFHNLDEQFLNPR